MPELSDFYVGQAVELPKNGVRGTVQFIGNTHFAPGDWIGVGLGDASGKNDGAVQGQRYFDCLPGHGIFVKPSGLTIVDEYTPRPNARQNGSVNGTATRGRPPSMAADGVRRQSVLDPTSTRRQSMNAGSPTPAARSGPGSRLAVSAPYDYLTTSSQAN